MVEKEGKQRQMKGTMET